MTDAKNKRMRVVISALGASAEGNLTALRAKVIASDLDDSIKRELLARMDEAESLQADGLTKLLRRYANNE